MLICPNPLLEYKQGKNDNYFPNRGEHLVLSFLKHEVYSTFEGIVSLQFLIVHNSHTLSCLISFFPVRVAQLLGHLDNKFLLWLVQFLGLVYQNYWFVWGFWAGLGHCIYWYVTMIETWTGILYRKANLMLVLLKINK